jgi:D-alanine-D-alanine ligase
MSRRRRLKVLSLFDLPGPRADQDFTAELETEDWRTEADILEALDTLGYEVVTIGVYDDVGFLVRRVSEEAPDVVFNLTEQFRGDRSLDMGVAGVLELLGVTYTGAGPLGLALARDKALAKKILTFHRVRVPRFTTFRLGRKVRVPRHVPYPVIVKPVAEDASEGITLASLVRSDQELAKRVEFVHETFGGDAIAEEYIEGREIYCAVLGNRRLTVLPLREVKIGGDSTRPKFLTYRSKWDEAYRQRWGIQFGFAEGIPAEKTKEIARISKRVCRALELRDYARVDLRLTADGRIYVIEANPNPHIAWGEDFAEAALEAGIDYTELIDRILRLAVRRRE